MDSNKVTDTKNYAVYIQSFYRKHPYIVDRCFNIEYATYKLKIVRRTYKNVYSWIGRV